MRFTEDLERGRLVAGTCPRCRITAWPPGEACSVCSGELDYNACPDVGSVVEFSRHAGGYFCLAEFGRVRIMGSLSCASEPRIGARIRLRRAGMRDGRYYFELECSD